MTVHDDILAELRKTNRFLEEIAKSLQKIADLPEIPKTDEFLLDRTHKHAPRPALDCSKCGKPGYVLTDGHIYCIEHTPSRFKPA